MDAEISHTCIDVHIVNMDKYIYIINAQLTHTIYTYIHSANGMCDCYIYVGAVPCQAWGRILAPMGKDYDNTLPLLEHLIMVYKLTTCNI